MKLRIPLLAGLVFARTCLAPSLHAQSMSIDSLDGPVTQNEISSFQTYVTSLTPAADNIGNAWAQGASGEQTKAMGLMYEVSHSTGILDQMIRFCDAVLSERNDVAASPVGHYTIWTGRIDPVWPNTTTTPPIATGGEQGDPIGHLAYCARLILQTPAIWNQPVGIGDPRGYGSTYYARAATFIAEADYAIDHHVLLSQLDLSHSNQLWFSAADPYKGGQPVPWNQVMMFLYGFENLAICHAILGDDPARTTQYDAIVQANLDWFFASGCTTYTDSAGRPAYDWSYVVTSTTAEDSNHGALDTSGFYRAYLTNRYTLTSAQMTLFANMVCDVFTGTIGSYYHGRVDGTDGTGHASSTSYLRSGYFVTAEFRPDQYYNLVSGLRLTAPGTTTSTDAFSRLMWIKHRRYVGAQDFSLSVTPSSATVNAGGTATYTVTVGAISGFSGPVSFSVSGLPSGATSTFSPSSINGSGTATLTIATGTATPAGTSALLITGTSGILSHSVSRSLVVNRPPVAAPVLSPGAGTYTANQSVTISSATSGASIRFTTDGSVPTSTTGTLYSGPINVATSLTVKAIAYKAGMTDSSVATASYTINSSGGAPVELAVAGSAVTASASTGSYVPANTLDGSLSTRWAGNGDGVWIRYDLGTVQTVTFVKLAWYRGTSCTYTFDVQLSTNGTTWTTVLNRVTSSGTTTALEVYNFPQADARYVRVVGHMNTVDTYTNITETEIWIVPSKLAVPAGNVTASAYTSTYVPANTIDGALSTRWAGNGDGVWIRYDLGAVRTVSYVKLGWYVTAGQTYTFDLQVSNDGSTWTTLLNRAVTSGATTALQTYDFASTTARYIRVVGHLSSVDNYTNITEAEVWGF